MKQGQIEFGESLMVVIVLVFLLGIGFIFYFTISSDSIVEELRFTEDQEALLLAQHVENLPELSCDIYKQGTCIDKLKIDELKELIDLEPSIKDYYFQLFGYSEIKIHLLSVDGNDDEDFLLYQAKPEKELAKTEHHLFTTIYDPVADCQKIAFFNVTRYIPEVIA